MNTVIDLNADLGEGAGDDAALIGLISSANISCGAHAGNEATISQALALCKKHGVRAGAHPGFADRAHFGRARIELTEAELSALVHTQLATIFDLARLQDIAIDYVKLHGALANMTAENETMALTAFQAVAAFDSHLAILTLEGSAQERAAERAGLVWVAEAYADRAYGANGLLAPRSTPGAVLTNIDEVVKRCLLLAGKGEIVTLEGSVLTSRARSICVHGDTPGAVEMAAAIRTALGADGIEILPFA
jgi:5-oxoprolinase (ATP-hydrolysing) subunit A